MELEKPEFSKKDMWWANSKIAVAVFVLSGIFFRFEHVEELLFQQVKTHQSEIDYVNDRMDKKTKRNEDRIVDLEKAVEKLKQPNSNKNEK